MQNLKIRIELEVLITKREGMIAENKSRELNGQAMAYHDVDFKAVAEDMWALIKWVME